jgi:hypothetical protein
MPRTNRLARAGRGIHRDHRARARRLLRQRRPRRHGRADRRGTISVVASTDVYGQIAETVGGDHVEVTSLISSFSQDPHEFEASASDQLTVSKAQLLIENGGGYDPFLDGIIAASGTKAPLISAVAFSPEWTGDDPTQPVEGFNEHVFYDPQVMVKVADEIAAQLGKIDPDAADDSRERRVVRERHRDAGHADPRRGGRGPLRREVLRHRARPGLPGRGRGSST